MIEKLHNYQMIESTDKKEKDDLNLLKFTAPKKNYQPVSEQPPRNTILTRT